jgi:hypothetical protein
MRFDSTSSYLSDSFIDTPISTQGFVPVALRQAVDKVIYQEYLRTKEVEHMKVLTLGLCRQVCVVTSKFSTKAGFCFWTKTLRIGDIFCEWGSAAEKVTCHKAWGTATQS